MDSILISTIRRRHDPFVFLSFQRNKQTQNETKTLWFYGRRNAVASGQLNDWHYTFHKQTIASVGKTRWSKNMEVGFGYM